MSTSLGQFITQAGLVLVFFAVILAAFKLYKGDKSGWKSIGIALLIGALLTTPSIVTSFIETGSNLIEKVPDSVDQLNNGGGSEPAPADSGE